MPDETGISHSFHEAIIIKLRGSSGEVRCGGNDYRNQGTERAGRWE
jgi:hypothetical protein